MRMRIVRAVVFVAVAVTPLATVAAVSALPTEPPGCVASGGRIPATFFDSRQEALADFERDLSLPAPPGREFEKVADDAIRAVVATLREELPVAAPPDGVHQLAVDGRQLGNVTVTKSEDGWAVTEYEMAVPDEVCDRIAELKQGG